MQLEGKKPIFEILEECNEKNWHEREAYYINKHNKKNTPLLNSYKGIFKRTEDNYREKLKQMLVNGIFYKFPADAESTEFIVKLENNKYFMVYGNKNTQAGTYYIFVKSERFFIPKKCSIYKKNVVDLPVLLSEYTIESGELLIKSCSQ